MWPKTARTSSSTKGQGILVKVSLALQICPTWTACSTAAPGIRPRPGIVQFPPEVSLWRRRPSKKGISKVKARAIKDKNVKNLEKNFQLADYPSLTVVPILPPFFYTSSFFPPAENWVGRGAESELARSRIMQQEIKGKVLLPPLIAISPPFLPHPKGERKPNQQRVQCTMEA